MQLCNSKFTIWLNFFQFAKKSLIKMADAKLQWEKEDLAFG
jgi:hypothetical protein